MSAGIFRPPRQPLVAPGQIEHHVADLTVTAAANITLARLQEKLAEQDQWLPIDGNPNLSLGTLVQINSSGPLRLGFGAWRDLLLGAQFTTRAGQLITAGGRAMKNVAGYDLTKFMVGQQGLFATLATITARTYKRPTGALLASFSPSAIKIGDLLCDVARPQWAMLAGNFLWCGYLGDDASLAFEESQLPSRKPLEVRRQSLQQDIEFRAARWAGSDEGSAKVRYRASIPPARVEEFMRQCPAGCAADPVFGIVVGSCDASQKDAIRARARGASGTIAFDDAQDASIFFGAGRTEVELLARLKSAFGTP